MKHKHFLLLLLGVSICTNAFMQPLIKWQKTIGGNSDDILLAVDSTSDRGLILGGLSRSDKSGEKSENSRGGYDGWIVKLDSSGNIRWDKTMGGGGDDYLNSLQQTGDGGYIIGVRSYSNKSGEKSENGKGSDDFWIIKLDGSGNIQWDKTIGGSGSDGTSIVAALQTSDGGYIVGGSSSSNKSGNKTENSRGGDDYWIVKLDASGNIQWDKTFGGSSTDFLESLEQTSDGGYILGGTSWSNKSGEKSENGRGIWDYWIVKVDASGNFQWDKTIGANANDGYSSMDVQQAGDGGYILAGASDSHKSGEKTQNSRGSWDYWIVKLDASGNIQWDKTIGGNGEDRLYHHSLQTTSDGGCTIFGWSASGISGEKTESSRGSHDYWIVKLNKAGHIQWDKTIGGNGTDENGDILACSRNHYILAGYSTSGGSGDKTQKSRGGYDYWIVKLVYNKPADIAANALPASTATSDNSSKSFIVYPNPAKNTVTVNYTAQNSSKYIFEITGISGNVLLRKEANAIQGANRITLDISRLFNGVYFINVIRPDNTRERIHLSKE